MEALEKRRRFKSDQDWYRRTAAILHGSNFNPTAHVLPMSAEGAFVEIVVWIPSNAVITTQYLHWFPFIKIGAR